MTLLLCNFSWNYLQSGCCFIGPRALRSAAAAVQRSVFRRGSSVPFIRVTSITLLALMVGPAGKGGLQGSSLHCVCRPRRDLILTGSQRLVFHVSAPGFRGSAGTESRQCDTSRHNAAARRSDWVRRGGAEAQSSSLCPDRHGTSHPSHGIMLGLGSSATLGRTTATPTVPQALSGVQSVPPKFGVISDQELSPSDHGPVLSSEPRRFESLVTRA